MRQREQQREAERATERDSVHTHRSDSQDDVEHFSLVKSAEVSVKRDLIQCQKRPNTVSKETL